MVITYLYYMSSYKILIAVVCLLNIVALYSLSLSIATMEDLKRENIRIGFIMPICFFVMELVIVLSIILVKYRIVCNFNIETRITEETELLAKPSKSVNNVYKNII